MTYPPRRNSTWFATRRWQRVRRLILVVCMDCFGSGVLRGQTCITCKGTGEIEKHITEIINEDE